MRSISMEHLWRMCATSVPLWFLSSDSVAFSVFRVLLEGNADFKICCGLIPPHVNSNSVKQPPA